MKKTNQDNVDYANGLIDSSYKLKPFYPAIAKTMRTSADIIKIQAVQLEQFERMVEDSTAFKEGDIWSWQGDGEDHLGSMSSEMKVIISAGELKELVQSKVINNLGTDDYDRAMSDGQEDDYDRAMDGI